MSSTRGKRSGTLVWLTMHFFEGGGDLPDEGDFFRTATGRCYQIQHRKLRPSGARYIARYRCRVLDDEAVEFGQPGVYTWTWCARRPANPGAFPPFGQVDK